MARDFTPYPLTFAPEILVKVWGGTKLVELFGKPPGEGPLGESWEVSAVTGHQSRVDAGPYAGEKLDALVSEFGSALVGARAFERHGDEFPLLLKLLDASDNLSVQVHPNQEQAEQLGGGARSKSEAWLILAVEPGAKLVHGVTEGLDRERFEELVRSDRIEECLRYIEPQPGDVVPVAAGTLHAIGKGVVLLELQESSDTTYRFYDYGRLGLDGKPRQLHVEQALEVVSLENIPPRSTPVPLDGPGRRELLYRDQAIEMQRWAFSEPVVLEPDCDRCWLLTTLKGSVTLRSDSVEPVVELGLGRSVLVPAGLGLELIPRGEVLVFLGSEPLPDQ